ncbi:MAG: molecular chaperone TorD family protein [Betaproteobacteria bacterium]|nr:molecular chaperone TorD family protein [Betaproteobacteria bacterium]
MIRELFAALADDAATLALLHDTELTAPLLAGLKHLGFPDNLGLLPVGEASRTGFGAMRAAVSSLPAHPAADTLDDLAADFAAIYLTGAYGASPSESFWLSDDHLVCQEAMFDLRAIYAATGLAAPDWRRRPDDHLVFQLQFFARRLAVAADDDRRALALLADFLDHHLLRWLPDFAARVAERCATPFYAGLARLTDAWCQQARDVIAGHLDEPRPGREEIARRTRRARSCREPAEVEPPRFVPSGDRPSW